MNLLNQVTFIFFSFGFTGCVKEYSEALEKSLLFYHAQRSGRLGPDNKISWRRDAHLDDQGSEGEDLSGV